MALRCNAWPSLDVVEAPQRGRARSKRSGSSIVIRPQLIVRCPQLGWPSLTCHIPLEWGLEAEPINTVLDKPSRRNQRQKDTKQKVEILQAAEQSLQRKEEADNSPSHGLSGKSTSCASSTPSEFITSFLFPFPQLSVETAGNVDEIPRRLLTCHKDVTDEHRPDRQTGRRSLRALDMNKQPRYVWRRSSTL
ncbi:hypothetical protein MHYP_G00042440 [Metynnis hypsauchen]